MDKNITKARSYFYEFLAYPLFFHTSEEGFARWKEQLSYLAQNPLSEQSAEAFANHKNANFFRSYAIILKDFIELERAVLSLEAPAKPQGYSVAMAALKKEPYQSKMPTIKTKLHWEEFSPVISHEFKD